MSSNTTHVHFQALHSAVAPSASSSSFSLSPTTTEATDIWQKPANPSSPKLIKTFNAPLIYKSIPLNTFKRARVTISAPWSSLYDQGGLVFILPSSGERKWIKSGIEFYKGGPYVSTVVCDRWADWSLVQIGINDGKVTLEMERDVREGTLWIYVVDGEKRIPVREVTWILSEEPTNMESWVGAYAASPTVAGRSKGLEVEFEGWELEVIQ